MNSLTLLGDEAEKLREYIHGHNLKEAPVTNKYELLRVKDQDVKLVLYSSGKLVFNESDETLSILNSILNLEEGYDYFLGSDETGKGEWYGPLVVVATALNSEEIAELRMMGVKDSKTMKTSRIMEISEKLLDMKIPHRTIVLTPHRYNHLYREFVSEGKSLNDLMAWAHSRVIHDLLGELEFKKAQVVIDLFDQKKTEERLGRLDKNRVEVIQKSGAESETPVAAASIIAKYLFEREITHLNEKYDINLKNMTPGEIDPEILGIVAKTHFKNVKGVK